MLTMTRGQLKLEKILNQLGFETVLEYRLGPYCVDVFVPSLNIAFEYLGPTHKLTKKKDTERTKELIETYMVSKVVGLMEKDIASTTRAKELILSAIDGDTSS